MKRIVVINNKGGVGKTTTADQIAVGYAMEGYRTLLGDVDQQANTTDMFSKKRNFSLEKFAREKLAEENYSLVDFERDFNEKVQEFDVDMADVLIEPKVIKEAIVETRYENLHLVPASMKLSVSDTKIKEDNRKPQHNRLDRALKIVDNDYDVCVIDCPPILNMLTVNALCACNEVIIPIKVDIGALKGFLFTMDFINEIVEGYDLKIKVKILFTMVNRNNEDKLTVELFKKMCPGQVFETTIRNQAKAITQAGFEQNLVIEDRKSKVGVDYQNLVIEIIGKGKND